MDNGGYVYVYSGSRYLITDEHEYFAVHDKENNYRQVAAFKEQDEALAYVLWRQQNGKD